MEKDLNLKQQNKVFVFVCVCVPGKIAKISLRFGHR